MNIKIKNFFTGIKQKFEQNKAEKKEVKLQNQKTRYISVLRLISILVIAILITITAGTMIFVYQSIMNTIGQVQSIALYQSELRVELIDFNRLDKIEKKWQEKITAKKIYLKRNPFEAASVKSISDAASTTEKIVSTNTP